MDSTLILEHLEQFASPVRRLTPDAAAEHERCQRPVGLALAACEKSVQIVYEYNLRHEDKRHEPWLGRVVTQMTAAFDGLEAELPPDGVWLFGGMPGQARDQCGGRLDVHAQSLPGAACGGAMSAAGCADDPGEALLRSSLGR
jgi:glutathione S-transferase